MKHIPLLIKSIAIVLISFSLNACSDDDDKQEVTGTIKVNGKDHKVLEAGCTQSLENDVICIQFITEDDEATQGKSGTEIQMALSLTEEWFTLSEDVQNWRVMLRNHILGDGSNMSVISNGRVLIKQLGNTKENKCKYQVSFEVSLIDGTTAVADIQGEFKNSPLWIGGR